jgi:hypothetical protein
MPILDVEVNLKSTAQAAFTRRGAARDGETRDVAARDGDGEARHGAG